MDGSWLVLCSDGSDWQSDRKWDLPKGRREGGPLVRSHKTISTLCLPQSKKAFEANVSEDWMRRKNDHLRDLPRSVNDWVVWCWEDSITQMLLICITSRPNLFQVPTIGLLIMSKCTEMARQPSHWVNLNGSNLHLGGGDEEREKGGTFSASALKTPPNPSPYSNEPISPP